VHQLVFIKVKTTLFCKTCVLFWTCPDIDICRLLLFSTGILSKVITNVLSNKIYTYLHCEMRNKIYLMHIPGLSKTSFHFQMLMRLWIQTMVSLWLMLTRWSSFSTMHLRQPNGWRITQSCPLKKSIVLIEAPGWWVIMIVQLDSLNIESSELSQELLVFSTHIVPLVNASWRKYTKQYSAIWLFHFAGSVSCPLLVLWKFKVSGANWWN